MTQGRSTAPRIMRLNQSCSLSRRASEIPITSLKATAMPVKTKAFWKVWRKASLSQSRTKFWMPMKWLGRPMKAFDSEKYSAMTNGYATRRTSRSMAGVTRTGPRTDSRSSHVRRRATGRGRPRGTGISSALTAMLGHYHVRSPRCLAGRLAVLLVASPVAAAPPAGCGSSSGLRLTQQESSSSRSRPRRSSPSSTFPSPPWRSCWAGCTSS